MLGMIVSLIYKKYVYQVSRVTSQISWKSLLSLDLVDYLQAEQNHIEDFSSFWEVGGGRKDRLMWEEMRPLSNSEISREDASLDESHT